MFSKKRCGILASMQTIGYHSLYTFMDGPLNKPGPYGPASVMAMFRFEKDISFLFPYINAVAEKAEMHETPIMIRFVFENVHCVVYPERCITSPFTDREEARDYRARLMDYLNSILARLDEIVPKYKVFKKIPVTEILKLLPKTNCKACGFKTCMAFAATLSRQQITPSACPYIGKPLSEKITYPVYDDTGNPVSSITLDVDSSNDRQPDLPADSDPQRPDPERKNDDANLSLAEPLSKRELEVLSMMAEGLTNPEISQALFISPHTVKSHVVHIFNKLGVNQRTQAVVWAARNRLV